MFKKKPKEANIGLTSSVTTARRLVTSLKIAGQKEVVHIRRASVKAALVEARKLKRKLRVAMNSHTLRWVLIPHSRSLGETNKFNSSTQVHHIILNPIGRILSQFGLAIHIQSR